MTNQGILDEIQCAWTVIKTEHPEYPTLADNLEKALVQLRARLQEPTDEERKEMLEYLFGRCKWTDEDEPGKCDTDPYCKGNESCKKFDAKFRAFIMSSEKRTVTREWITAFELDMRCLFGLGPRRSFIERKLAELGITIDKGDVPIFNENGHSNEGEAMTNQGILDEIQCAWTVIFRAMLQEPRLSDAAFINHIQAHLDPSDKVICKLCGKTAEEICDGAFIMSSKRTVTREWVEGKTKYMAEYPSQHRLEMILAELGISISDKGDVPIFNEEGHSNEVKP